MTESASRWFTQSIKGRLLCASLLLLPLLVALTGFGLDTAFKQSLLAAEQARLRSQVYLLLAAAEVDEGELVLPKAFTEPLLSQANSGLYGFVHADKDNHLDNERELWRSASAQWLATQELGLNQSQPLRNAVTEFGRWQGSYFYLRYRIRWEFGDDRELPLVFSVYQTTEPFNQQLASFRTTLWRWLAVIGVGSLLLQGALLMWGLRPLKVLTQALSQLNRGEQARVEGQFPQELQGLTENLNQLLASEQTARERYRNTLADLAHSLKTPLSVARNELHTQAPDQQLIGEQLARMHDIINHQLQRARMSEGGFQLALDVQPIVQRITRSLQKLYPAVTFVVPDTPMKLRIDEKDAFEILGNVIENACKYGATKVQVGLENLTYKGLPFHKLVIADNGPGVAPDAREQLVRRGQRLDEQRAGQGLGLALVQDILVAYGGELQLEAAHLGGLGVVFWLPEKSA
ncbi:ATP-binding protein [Simiduia sp. 21SJ11W-1]|uniref:ATP-binding protein n=1 Tax=Simiduia sp. 21SJ11W-1 TaxID=2909669 RepID=UPI00209FF323|nr:ATP-binding protein [Simiduia sp. 21SJ11W-1]UTA46488.1 ATP-binding protein [Simiduia sp. 21SJ11W-1]